MTVWRDRHVPCLWLAIRITLLVLLLQPGLQRGFAQIRRQPAISFVPYPKTHDDKELFGACVVVLSGTDQSCVVVKGDDIEVGGLHNQPECPIPN